MNSKRCRLCNVVIECSTAVCKDVLTYYQIDDNISQMITFCLSIEVNIAETLPDQICMTCHENIIKFYHFKKECLKNDEHFRYLYTSSEKHLSIKEETRNDDGYNQFCEVILTDTPNVKIKQECIDLESINDYFETTEHKFDVNIKQEPDINKDIMKSTPIVLVKKLSTSVNNESTFLVNQSSKPVLKQSKSVVNQSISEGNQSKLADEHYLRSSEKQNTNGDVNTTEECRIINLRRRKKPRIYKCPVCGMNFINFSNLQHHRVEDHLNLDPFWCYCCSDTFVTIDLLLLHIKNSHIFCRSCKTPFQNRDKLKRHSCQRMKKLWLKLKGLRVQKELERSKQNVLGTPSSSVEESRSSSFRIEKTIFSCFQCGKSFKDKGTLICHQALAHPGKPIDRTNRPRKAVLFCTSCLLFFKDAKEMKFHKCIPAGSPIS